MFWIDKKSYERTLAVLKEEVALTPLFIELKQYLEAAYGLTIYDITFEKFTIFNTPKKYSLAYGKRYQLICQVASNDERESMQNKIFVENIGKHSAYKMEFDKKKQTQILSKFFELAKKHNFSINAKENQIWLDYHWWFPIDHMSFIVSKIEAVTSKEVISKYKTNANIWKIITNGFGIVVFYMTESQKIVNAQSGVTDSIRNEYFTAVKAIDEFDFYKEKYITFDSKENLDKNYSGSLYYYMR